MAESLRFWQRLPRLAFGLASFAVLTVAIMGKDFLLRLRDISVHYTPDEPPAVFSGVLSIFLLLAAGAIGIFMLELLVGGFGIVTRRLANFSVVRRMLERLELLDIALPIDQLVVQTYQRDRGQVLDFFRLRSEATPGHEKDSAALKKFYRDVGEHLDRIRNPSLMVALAYYSSFTQDQAKVDQWEFAIKDFYYFLLFLCSSLVCGLRTGASLKVSFLFLALLLSAAVLSLPLIRDRKRRLASLLLASYCDNFAVAEGGVVEDRSDT